MQTTLFLVGPTAGGKTDVALALADLMPIEIVSLDSMSIYRGMDIATAKPSPEERARVPHHLIDVVDPDAPFSVGRYVAEAQRVMEDIRRRRRMPLFVGGTPLYLKALTGGLFEGPEADWQLRTELRERAEREGPDALHRELARMDPEAATRIHANDLRRIVRAIEVFRKTGRPISELQTQWSDSAEPDGHSVIAGISRDREALYRRIEARVDAMFAQGLLDEVRTLLARYGSLGREASQAVGYKEVLAHLAGEYDLSRAVELVKRDTRRLAKRQLTWLRSFDAIRWFPMEDETTTAAVARSVAAYYAEAQEPSPSGEAPTQN
jgi:tRNA dimethylallyltransferase